MHDVRCRGCKRGVGVANDQHNGVYCAPACADDFPAGPNEARDSLIELLVHLGVGRGAVLEEFGLTKQRLSQILSMRRLAA